MNVYIRDLVTGKAAPVAKEEEFKAQYPSGKYVYFNASSGDLVDPPSEEKAASEPKLVEERREFVDPPKKRKEKPSSTDELL